MILKVNKDICEIKQNEVWNVGDYNVHTVQVELSEEFDGLVNKVRYFVEDNSYDMLITDNVAQVPYEATLTEGTIKIGVYGYDADTNILVQSTSPVNKYISSGTYTGEADNTEPLTPTDKQQMESTIQQNTDDIIVLQNNKQDVLISGENIKTINNESILGSGNIEIDVGSINYNELENKPKINNIELTGNKTLNNLGIQPAGNYALESEIPDVSNFITNSVNNLLNYYLKSETYTKQEVNNLIGQIATLQFQVVSTLPQIGDSKYIYLVPSSNPKTQNVKDEYIWVNNSWEQIGSTQIDLTGYATENWVNTQISEFLTQTQIQALINTALSEYTETDPTVPSYVKNITQANITSWNNKSDFSGSYNDLTNKPSINNVTLSGNKSLNDLGIQPVGNYALESDMTEAQNDIENLQTENERLKATLPTTTGEGENVTLDKTAEFEFVKPPLPRGNSEQNGEPSPDNEVPITNVTGNVEVTISNENNTESKTLSVSLGNIELCKIGNYQDYLYKNNGKWYVHKNIIKIDLSTITSYIHTPGWRNPTSFVADNVFNHEYSGYTTVASLFCNRLIADTPARITGSVINAIGLGRNSSIYISVEGITTSNALITYFSQNPTYLYAPLATPTDTEITDTTLISQLEEISKTLSYQGQTNITSNTIAMFDVEAYQSTKLILENLDSRLTLVEG